MIIYRPYRGNFADAMLEVERFNNEEEMKQYIVERASKIWGLAPFDVCDIVIDSEIYCTYENRTGWENIRRICVKRYFDNVYKYPQCIGYCATDYRDKE